MAKKAAATAEDELENGDATAETKEGGAKKDDGKSKKKKKNDDFNTGDENHIS